MTFKGTESLFFVGAICACVNVMNITFSCCQKEPFISTDSISVEFKIKYLVATLAYTSQASSLGKRHMSLFAGETNAVDAASRTKKRNSAGISRNRFKAVSVFLTGC